MKTCHSIAATLAALALPLCASAGTLNVTIDKIDVTEGTVRIGLYTADGYEAGDAVAGASVAVDGPSITASFEDLAEGEYAIKLYHDVNNDGEMATNPFGMPTEPFAFSNNARGRFGPASWDAARFSVTGATTVHSISLN